VCGLPLKSASLFASCVDRAPLGRRVLVIGGWELRTVDHHLGRDHDLAALEREFH
jgi:hypothetical protein